MTTLILAYELKRGENAVIRLSNSKRYYVKIIMLTGATNVIRPAGRTNTLEMSLSFQTGSTISARSGYARIHHDFAPRSRESFGTLAVILVRSIITTSTSIQAGLVSAAVIQICIQKEREWQIK